MAYVFINYGGQIGEDAADGLKAKLLNRAQSHNLTESDMDVFVAPNSIDAGKNWEDDILKNIRQCEWFLCVVTEGYNESQFAQQELGAAVVLKKQVIPILGDGMTSRDLRGFIQRKQAAPTTGKQDKIDRLMNNIIKHRQAAVQYSKTLERQREQMAQAADNIANISPQDVIRLFSAHPKH